MTGRASAIAKARKLRALAEHPDTPGPEAESARRMLLDLRDKHSITDRELGISDGRPWARDELYEALRRTIGERYTERVYSVFRIDYLLDVLGQDEQSRKLIDGALAELVRIARTPRRNR